MSIIRGCDLPDDVYYFIEKHVWAKPAEGGMLRVGMTSVAGKLSGGSLSAVTYSKRKLGKQVAQGKSLATVESSKYVGPVPAPVTGVLVKGNPKLESDPNLAISDPYGEGWIAEFQPLDWDTDKGSLAYGSDGIAAYQAVMEAEDISCD